MADEATKLSTHLDTVDAEFLFQVLAAVAINRNSRGEPESEVGALPSMLEFASFLLYPQFGLSTNREPSEIQACCDLLKEHHRTTTLADAFDVDHSDLEIASILVHLRLHELGIRGEAYGCHTREMAQSLIDKFSNWCERNCGLRPERAYAILDSYEKAADLNHRASANEFSVLLELREQFLALAEDDFDAAVQHTESRESVLKATQAHAALCEYPAKLAVSLDQVRALDPATTAQEWQALKRLVGMTVERRTTMSHWREVRKTPLFFLRDDRMLAVELSSTYEAVLASLESAIRSDPKQRDKYESHASSWTEGAVAGYLKRVFPDDCVYANLTYPDPDHEGAEAELDCGVQWGPYLLLIEIKGKQFRDSSRWGDRVHLRTDLKKNVEEAFEQSQRASRYVAGTESPIFAESKSGRKLVVTKSRLTTVFAISVTRKDFRGLLTHLAKLSSIGLFTRDVYPWGVSLNDLNIITNFLTIPDAFVHYIKRRIEMQRANSHIEGDEIDLFSTYLINRLDPKEVWDRLDDNGVPFGMVMVAPCSQEIDRWYAIEQGTQKGPKPKIGLELPRCLDAALVELAGRMDDESRLIAVTLLDLPREILVTVDKRVDAYLSRPEVSKLGRLTIHHEGVPIVMLFGGRCPVEKAIQSLKLRMEVEAYRCRSGKAIGLYFLVNAGALAFHTGAILERAWAPNEALDEYLEHETVSLPPGEEPPDPYGPCFCGSGKKFKFCCRPKIKKHYRHS